ncbi:MAG: glycogen/starch synthase, partial [candidate division Zixibacteria bacterium]|nr:glycogen/starch synthase [candidate division Zixibacteria bacterium]
FTIHNVAYQGHFPKETFFKLGINPHLFYPASPFEFWGKVNFMKIGISYADIINTVSERYAVEIQSDPEFGHGLEGVLRERNADLFGIINGIDYDDWNPEKDGLIPIRYGPRTLEKKKKNKEALLKKCGLSGVTDPLLGMITRLVDQKGLDLFAEIADDLLALKVKMVVLGTGDERYHELFKELEKKYPKKIKAFLTFDNKLAHGIEAGSDLFLMPSRYEPCGLNQLYSLKYGTVPVVRETGGLADTVEPADEKGERGTGFVFTHYDSGEFFDSLKKALSLYGNKAAWKKLQLRGMEKDFSWHASAVKYLDLYQKALAKEPVEAA